MKHEVISRPHRQTWEALLTQVYTAKRSAGIMNALEDAYRDAWARDAQHTDERIRRIQDSGEARPGRGRMQELAEKRERARGIIIDLLRQHPESGVSQVSPHIGFNRHATRDILQAMEDEGAIVGRKADHGRRVWRVPG